MRLAYRGAEYDVATPATDDTVNGCVGKYRGITVTVSQPRAIVNPSSAIGLRYRGASYLKLH